MEPIHGTIKNWLYNKNTKVVTGLLFDDTKGRFRDGTFVTTSTVLKKRGNIITTRNSRYRLEDPFVV